MYHERRLRRPALRGFHSSTIVEFEGFEPRGLDACSTNNCEDNYVKANDKQVGGNHYKKGGEEHWDRAYRLNYDPFQYIITKWIERWREKGGVTDLKKARHAIDKYIEVAEAEEARVQGLKAGVLAPKLCRGCNTPVTEDRTYCAICAGSESSLDPAYNVHFEGEEPGAGYVNQD